MKQSLGQKLKARRINFGYSLRVMAREIDLAPQTILNIENEAGTKGGSFKNVVKMARFLSIPIDELAKCVR